MQSFNLDQNRSGYIRHTQKIIVDLDLAPSQNTSTAGPCSIIEPNAHVVQGWSFPEDLELNIIWAAAVDPIYSKIVTFFKKNNYKHELWAKPNNHKAFGLQITQISAPGDWLREFTRLDILESLEKVAMVELKLALKDDDRYHDSPASTSSSLGSSTKTVIMTTEV